MKLYATTANGARIEGTIVGFGVTAWAGFPTIIYISAESPYNLDQLRIKDATKIRFAGDF